MRILLMYSLAPPSPAHLERLRQLGSDLELVVATDEATALSAAGEAEVILGHRFLRQCLPVARRLRWVQTSAQGVDRLPLEVLAERGIVLTRSTLDADSVALHAVALAWALTRAIPEAWRNQQAHRWDQRLHFAAAPRKALVMGYGPIGQSIARRLAGQGIETVCARRRIARIDKDAACPRFVTGDDWRGELADSDWCFLALPHSPETSGMFDEPALRALPAHAVLVNVGRGETLDTAALQRVLDSGHLAGAGLDVVDPEPLPPEHPLWQAPRLLITPHVASHQPGRNERVEAFFERQVQRFLSGEPLLDQVDLEVAIRQRPTSGAEG